MGKDHTLFALEEGAVQFKKGSAAYLHLDRPAPD